MHEVLSLPCPLVRVPMQGLHGNLQTVQRTQAMRSYSLARRACAQGNGKTGSPSPARERWGGAMPGAVEWQLQKRQGGRKKIRASAAASMRHTELRFHHLQCRSSQLRHTAGAENHHVLQYCQITVSTDAGVHGHPSLPNSSLSLHTLSSVARNLLDNRSAAYCGLRLGDSSWAC